MLQVDWSMWMDEADSFNLGWTAMGWQCQPQVSSVCQLSASPVSAQCQPQRDLVSAPWVQIAMQSLVSPHHPYTPQKAKMQGLALMGCKVGDPTHTPHRADMVEDTSQTQSWWQKAHWTSRRGCLPPKMRKMRQEIPLVPDLMLGWGSNSSISTL